MRVIVTGASGTIGGALAQALRDRGDSVTGITRAPADQGAGVVVDWRSWDDLPAAVAEADAVVHLAGAGLVEKRWSARRKQVLRDSRIETARRVVEAIRRADRKPTVLVSGSAVGYYGSRGDALLAEEEPAGMGFLARLCSDWEEAARGAGVRTIILRVGVVLALEGGALGRLVRPFKWGLGGPIGRGRQYLSWIHRDDVVGILLHAIDQENTAGVINAVAPQPVTNVQFSRSLARVLRRPALMRVPPFVLRLQLGEASSVVTSSQRVRADRIAALGYEFRYPEVEGALRDLLR